MEKGIAAKSEGAREDISKLEGVKKVRKQKVRKLWEKLRRWRRKAVERLKENRMIMMMFWMMMMMFSFGDKKEEAPVQ